MRVLDHGLPGPDGVGMCLAGAIVSDLRAGLARAGQQAAWAGQAGISPSRQLGLRVSCDGMVKVPVLRAGGLMTPALAASYLHVFAEAAGHDPAGGGLRRILAFGLFMAAALLFGASYFTAVELGAFKAPLFLGATAWLLLGAAFVAASPFLGGSSLAAALEYVVISAGTAILIAVFWGLLALTALACDYPLPAGLSAAGVAVLCLAGAIVSAAAGSRWAALGGLAAAMLLILAAGGCFGQRGWPYDSANPPPAPRAESPRRRPLQYAAWSSLLSGRWSR